eukprot:CAMPEP_0173417610 /NCGR_PEP_ID=MMETSP1356-20130122/85989_1 /TAXON_ID=77927 ORGANISM="Hemiselmis virescens, Strain PCC157" /NCGR_SAMPLE_ID=MMETSP1356 /ASSEMBLY_ACC=CAM_ASM_000847 /LENGTH=94 /DNA_ID=CAMNT_0014379943 /DNA_START=1147 /DNA_END=1430 /DNA_ORIENTATION=-
MEPSRLIHLRQEIRLLSMVQEDTWEPVSASQYRTEQSREPLSTLCGAETQAVNASHSKLVPLKFLDRLRCAFMPHAYNAIPPPTEDELFGSKAY